MSVKPITPSEARAAYGLDFPDWVIDTFNKVITKNLKGKVSRFTKDEVLIELEKQGKALACEIYDKHWLDVEPLYMKFGWLVEYDRPGYNESYSGEYKFTMNE